MWQGRTGRRAENSIHVEIVKELSSRAAIKTQKKVERERKDVEEKVKRVDVHDINATFANLDDSTRDDLADILTGAAVGRNICHTWYDADSKEKIVYSGRVEKAKKRKGHVTSYIVGYWNSHSGESYDDAVDYTTSKYELGADLICDDLMFTE